MVAVEHPSVQVPKTADVRTHAPLVTRGVREWHLSVASDAVIAHEKTQAEPHRAEHNNADDHRPDRPIVREDAGRQHVRHTGQASTSSDDVTPDRASEAALPVPHPGPHARALPRRLRSRPVVRQTTEPQGTGKRAGSADEHQAEQMTGR